MRVSITLESRPCADAERREHERDLRDDAHRPMPGASGRLRKRGTKGRRAGGRDTEIDTEGCRERERVREIETATERDRGSTVPREIF